MSDIASILIDGQNVDKVALRNYLAAIKLFQTDLGTATGATKVGNGSTTVAAALTALQTAQAAGVIGKDTLSALNADLAHAADVIAYVTNDPTPANNGIYRKTGSSGSGSWVASSFDRTALVEAVADRYVEYFEQGVGKVNGWPDPFFRSVNLVDGIFLGRDRWWKNADVTDITLKWALIDNPVFDGYALRNTNVGGASQLSGPKIYMTDLNAEAGDEVTIYTLWVGDGGDAQCPGRWRDAFGAFIGSQLSPVNSGGGSTISTTSATPQWLRFVLTVPSGAVDFVMFPFTTTGSLADLVACWAFRGDQTKGPSWPTLDITPEAEINEYAPELVLPPTCYGLQSLETNLYFDNALLADYRDFEFRVSTAVAGGTRQQLNERFKWVPAGSVTSGALSVNVVSKKTGVTLSSGSINLRAAAASAGTGTTKTAIVVGDSLIAAGTITQTLLDLAGADVMDLTLLGTLGTGSNKHEGRGGWTIATYTTDYSDGTYGANPFWFSGAVNFSTYLTSNSLATPDWVIIQLGINDIFGQSDDGAARDAAQANFTLLDTLITSAKAAGAGLKVGLMIPTPPSYDQDAFGLSEDLGYTRARFKRNIVIWARELILKYAGQEANRIYIVPSNLSLDTENNMSRASSTPVNARSSVNVTRQNNGVHPGTEGYYQIADAVWAFLKVNA